ncbi:uncharacterized protein LOC108231234 [Kryptolebias marmoratus]|uniref:uncharacterized protein LOC108231234 n=1 Tax=Kryptolebias marmoratus TaxID=37003 RepID=UPI0018ACEA8A|nr:uncharacterized protein LOC108231234 [Kryptolebias marmoratus]
MQTSGDDSFDHSNPRMPSPLFLPRLLLTAHRLSNFPQPVYATPPVPMPHSCLPRSRPPCLTLDSHLLPTPCRILPRSRISGNQPRFPSLDIAYWIVPFWIWLQLSDSLALTSRLSLDFPYRLNPSLKTAAAPTSQTPAVLPGPGQAPFQTGYTLVPVTTVQLGEPVTFTCPLPEDKDISGKLYWYKQNAGDSMKLIALLWIHAKPENGPASSASRLIVTIDEKISNLTILRTVQGDEGMYHCAFNDWKNHSWHGNYLSLKGNSDGTSNYTVVEQRTSSDPDRPGGSVSLQCSVLSDSDNKTCSGGLRVFWFRSRSDKSYPDIIYADGNRHDECEKKPDSQKRCVFSKNISSSDAESYYCAVATCGQIIFGKGIKIEAGQTADPKFITLMITIICLAISVIVNIVFICYQNPRAKGTERTSSPTRHENLGQPRDYINEDGQDLNYVALRFSGGKSSRGKKKKELKTEESVYSHVKI